MRLLEHLIQDLRYALRTLAGHPLFTAMALLSLGLGIGANTAIFSFMDSILFRALPVRNPESLVVLNWHSADHPAVAHNFTGSTYKDSKTGYTSGNFPYATLNLFAGDRATFSHLFAFSDSPRLNVQIRGQADLASARYVSGGFFAGLAVPPAAGRLIDSTDDRAGAAPVAAVSFAYAQRRFRDAVSAVGQPALINDTPFTIAGVAAPEFFGINPGGPTDVYLPMHTSLLLEKEFPNDKTKYDDENSYWVQLMGRLRPGVTRAQAQAALAPPFARFIASTAKTDKDRQDLPALLVQEGAGGLDSLRRQYSKPLYILMAMVGLILAIACANIANLLLARAAGRRREMALRLSLGAGQGRLVRQLLTESLLLASLGGALGVLFGAWGIRALTLLIANGRDNFTLYATLNWRVLGLTVAISLAAGLLFGLAPAIQSSRLNPVTALKQTRGGEGSVRFGLWRRLNLSHALTVSQMAISLLLLLAAGMFVRTLNNLNSVQLGFNRENLLLVSLNAAQAGYKEGALVRFYQDLQERLGRIPGVRAVSFSSYALVSGSRNTTGLTIPGRTAKKNETSVMSVGADFLATMQIPVILGRGIGEREVKGANPVVVVNELFVKTYFGGENPIGRHFILSRATPVDVEIVGVARTARLNSLKQDAPEVVYVPLTHAKGALRTMVYELRAAGDPNALAAGVRQAVRQADARIPIASIVTQARQIDQTIGQERTFAMLCTCFALLAVVIACVGLYGTMAYNVARRTGEFGIRMALGATRRGLVWMVLQDVLLLAGVGMAAGLSLGLAGSSVVKSFLFQMKPNDPATMTAAAAVLLLAALAAGWGPAWRASRIDPWVALRDE